MDSIQVDFAHQKLSDAIHQAKNIYEENGCFLAKGLFKSEDLQPICYDIEKLIKLLYQHKQLELFPELDGNNCFDDGLTWLAAYDRQLVARIFDACRRLLPVHVISVDQRLQEISRILTKSEILSASDIKAIRIDLPNEEKYLFDWHQDYPYVMDSLDALVFWIPLQDVDEINGCLNIALGSHKLGLQKLTILDHNNKQNNKQKFMQLAHPEVVNQFSQIRVPCQFGDVLVFSTLLLHASGANMSQRARFTLQVRFGNFAHPMAIEKGWPGSLRDGTFFHETHAESVEYMV